MPYRLTITKRTNEVREIEYESRKLALEHFQKSALGTTTLFAVLEKRTADYPHWVRVARMDIAQEANDGGEGVRTYGAGFGEVADAARAGTMVDAPRDWPQMRRFETVTDEEIPF